YLAARSDVKFVPCGTHPDYMDLEGAAPSGRALAAEMFDGRLLGKDFARVRPPIAEFMVFGGMMVGKNDIPRLVDRFKSVSNFWYAGKLFARYLVDRLTYPRGTRVAMGNALVSRLFYSLRKLNVPVNFETSFEELVYEDGRVTGAIVTRGGKRLAIGARRGVVLATGGYAHNATLRKQFMPEPTPLDSLAVSTNHGDGISAALKIGAKVDADSHRTGAFWTPTSRTSNAKGGWFPHLSLDRGKPGVIAVNSAGRRFANEADSYHHFVEAMFRSNTTVPTIPAYLICETRFIAKYGLGAIYPGTRNLAPYASKGDIVIAPTLEALATKLNIDAVGLVDTVKRFNGFAVTGIDEDYGRGTTELNRFNGDPAHKPNPCIGPLERGPFCAMAVWPAEIACSTGLETDDQARVLDQNDVPIEGLYACGNDLASVMRGTYPGPGTTLGPALFFGYQAAMHAKHGAAQALDAAAISEMANAMRVPQKALA
ncbi:MAG: FAD-binding protein, partial [Janthinobacterium lividum]